jgi:hypothetical protein
VTESTDTQGAAASTGTKQQPGLKFEVVAGAHRGAALLLEEGDYRIGSSPDADIVLSDRGVAPGHAVLHVDGRGGVRLSASGADVTVEREPLPVSHGCRVRLPASFTLGPAEIHLSRAEENAAGRAIAIRRGLVAVAVLAGVGLAVAVARELLPVVDGDVGRAVRTATSGDGAGGDSVGSLSRPPAGPSTALSGSPSGPTMDDALKALNERLEAEKIETLKISTENGRLAATGTLTGPAADKWAAIQQWFDQTYGSRFVLATRLDPPEAPRSMPALHLEAIWYGERPYIVTADGEHYFTGAVLNNGWVVRDIDQNRVLLAKGGETVALKYR